MPQHESQPLLHSDPIHYPKCPHHHLCTFPTLQLPSPQDLRVLINPFTLTASSDPSINPFPSPQHHPSCIPSLGSSIPPSQDFSSLRPKTMDGAPGPEMRTLGRPCVCVGGWVLSSPPINTFKVTRKVKGRNEAPSPGRWWGDRAQATGAGPGLQAWLQALPSGAWGLPGGQSLAWQSWRGSLPRPRGSTCGCPPGGHCPQGTGGTATSEHFGSVGRGLPPGRPPGVAGEGAAPRQRTPRWARVRETLPPPVHFGAGDPVGRAEVGGHLPQDPRSSPPPERPRPRPGPAPAGPAPAPRPGGSRLARPGPGLPLPVPAPPRPRAPQAWPGLTGEAVPPARRRGSKLPSSVRPSQPLPPLPLPVPVPRPPQPPPPPPLGGHCPFKSLPPPPRPPGAPP